MDDAKPQLGTMDIAKLLALLPHRYPFMLVDRITEIDGDRSCVGMKNVTFNEPMFTGHFPEVPIFPGVLLIEGMAQTAGAIAIAVTPRPSDQAAPSKVFFMTIDAAKFRKPVVPGDTVYYHMTKLSMRRNMWWYRGEAKVDGAIVAEAKIGAMLVGA